MASTSTQPTTGLAARAQEPGDFAKWLVAALGGVGAGLLGGVQLAKFGNITGQGRLIVTIVAGLLATIGLIATVMFAVSVMLPATVSLGELRAREKRNTKWKQDQKRKRDFLIGYIEDNADELLREERDTIEALEADYKAALDARHSALTIYYEHFGLGTVTHEEEKLARDTSATAERMNSVVVQLVAAAKLHQTRHAFMYARRAVCVLAVLIAASVIALTWAANAPDHPALDLRGANLQGAALHDVSLKNVVLDGMTIKNADLAGTYLGGASIDGTKWIHVMCPDGVMSDNAGDTCAGHLEP